MSDARIDVVHFKAPPIVKEEIERIAKQTKRTVSTVTFYLVLRGLEGYHRDGELFGEEDELAFLRSDSKSRGKKGRSSNR